MNATRRCLSLIKGEQRFVFWYHQGQESDVMASLVGLAEDPQSGFDWMDAAALSYQLGRPAGRCVTAAAAGSLFGGDEMEDARN